MTESLCSWKMHKRRSTSSYKIGITQIGCSLWMIFIGLLKMLSILSLILPRITVYIEIYALKISTILMECSNYFQTNWSRRDFTRGLGTIIMDFIIKIANNKAYSLIYLQSWSLPWEWKRKTSKTQRFWTNRMSLSWVWSYCNQQPLCPAVNASIPKTTIFSITSSHKD